MKRYTRNNAFTLIELLAVIVVLGIIMLIAVISVSGIIEKSKKDAFIDTAQSYIAGARDKVIEDDMILPTVQGDSIIVYLDSSMVEDDSTISPYNERYILKGNSYTETDITNANSSMTTALSNVKITCSTVTDGECNYTYLVFLSDGKNATGCYDDTNKIGNATEQEDDINVSNIKKLAICQ